MLRKLPEFVVVCCALLCVSCETTTPLTPEEKARLAEWDGLLASYQEHLDNIAQLD